MKPEAGRMLGAALQRFATQRRRIAVANVARAFPDMDSAARRELVRASFEHAGHCSVEALRTLAGLPPASKRFTFHGAEQVDTALALGRGVVLLQARFSCLDAAASAINARWPVTAVSGITSGTGRSAWLRRRRTRLLTGMVGTDDLAGMRSVLERGEVLWLCPDVRVPKARCGIASRYFGQVAMSSGSPALLAKLTGAALVPYAPLRDGTNYRLRFDAPLVPGARVADTTQRLNDLFEAQVRDAPEQYLWMNRRFEAAPVRFLDGRPRGRHSSRSVAARKSRVFPVVRNIDTS